jgi:hypothetical protein
MAETVRPSSDDRCELEPVTCWPLIWAAGGTLLLGAAVAVTLFAYDLLRPRATVAEAPPPAKAADEPPAASPDRGPDLPPVTVAEPPRAAPVRRVVAREYAPLPPAKPPETEEWGLRVRLKAKAGKTDKDTKKAGPAESLPRQRHTLTREELLASLQKQAVELDLDSEKDAGKKLLEAGQKHAEKLKKIRESKDETEPFSLSSPLETLLASRKDLKGLSLLPGRACQTDEEQAKVLGTVSLKFRRLQSVAQRQEARNTKTKTPSQSPSYSYQDEAAKLADRQLQLGYVDKGLKDFLYVSVKADDAARLVRPFEQTYQTETPGMRVELVAALDKVKGKQATQAIARRAVFDLSPLVREEAVNALRGRGYEEAREVFLAAMRHPWVPAADHAAEALVALEDDGAVKELTALLDLPDPSLPVKQGDRWTSKQLVRVNHLRNCLLCHAPSTETSDLVRAPIPTPGEPLPTVYYGSQSRSRGPSVRADVVYFRQDFSAMHEVAKPNKWPAVQRFDYLVQTREVSADVAAQRLKEAKERKTYPQREAVTWALALLQRKQLD